MKSSAALKFFLSVFIAFSASVSRADDMTVFLKSCAVGTAAGAILGLASVALSENPSDKMGNVAKGASLGLYAGIGFGLYTLYGPQRGQMEFSKEENVMKNPIWISAIRSQEKIVGAQINWAHFSF